MHDIQAWDGTSIFRRLTLSIIEVSRNGDNSVSDLLSKVCFLQRANEGTNDEWVAETRGWLTAISRILPRTMAEISSGVKSFCSLPVLIWMIGFEFFSMTLNGKCLMSCWTLGSLKSRPMRRLASKTVSRKRQVEIDERRSRDRWKTYFQD